MDLCRGAGDEHVLAPGRDALDDRFDLLGGLARSEDGLGKATAEGPMVIHLGEAQVLEGKGAQALRRLRGSDAPVANGFEEVPEVFGVH